MSGRNLGTGIDAVAEADQLAFLDQLAERAQHLTFAAEIEELAREKGVVAALR